MAVENFDNNFFGMPLSIKRTNPAPLDNSCIYTSLDEAKEYAKTGATAYVGQLITVLDAENKKAYIYQISNSEGKLIEFVTMANFEKLIEKLVTDEELEAHSKLDIHVTQADRTLWNSKADSSTLSDHMNNKTIHVTQDDKTKWNKVVENLRETDGKLYFRNSEVATAPLDSTKAADNMSKIADALGWKADKK